MRQLFEDEDARMNAAAKDNKKADDLTRPESSEWDLHNHRLVYEETLRKRQQHLDQVEASKKSKAVADGSLKIAENPNPSDNNEKQPTSK